MPDMTGEFKRKLDLADKASIDLIALNNKVSTLQKIIRIYHECEGRIEKFVPRITVWHHEE